MSFCDGIEFQRFKTDGMKEEKGTLMGYVKYKQKKKLDTGALVPYVWMDGDDWPAPAGAIAQKWEFANKLVRPCNRQEVSRCLYVLREMAKQGSSIEEAYHDKLNEAVARKQREKQDGKE